MPTTENETNAPAPTAAPETAPAVAAAPSLASKDASDEARRQAARLMGQARTPKKLEALRRNSPINGLKGGRPPKPLSEIECRCGAGDSLEGHKSSCPRGLAIRRRKKAGKL